MFPRLAAERLKSLAAQFPAVLILGARQVGKTTLAKAAFPGHAYTDLETPRLRELFAGDAAFQIRSRAGGGLILDEAQAVPQVFAALRGIIDEDRARRGSFVLLGSAQPQPVRGVSESLAGRVGILELDPLTAAEASGGPAPADWRRLWLAGGFPDAIRGDFREWHEAYLRTYIERDLPQLGIDADPLFFRRLLTMLAHQQGGLLNIAALAGSMGVTHGRISRAIDIFEQTFLLRRLPPFFRNAGKRLTKSPKTYLRDTGLLHHLLNIGSLAELDAHPVRGASWETFVIEDMLRRERLARPFSQPFFWRTAAGAEVDLLFQRGDAMSAIEIKAGVGTPRQARHMAETLPDIGATAGWIVDQGEGEEAMNAAVRRRGFGSDIGWLP
ncbi:MAG: ATP-binding protein [Candidatus Nitricoxidivorans perseverans]|uniref:ATP-binding protein n=1 Tax=Candidatus Nitricoxidivorans perseverans TaxID=2975601 RepID=A0AA49FK44_9PROT|nr:MAG: ATP-binding protein [Candidatus Nitricoxidivorans perseverans]